MLELLATGLAWDTQDPRSEVLFRWKHVGNTFGASPSWVALDDGRVVGFRAFMRWEFVHDGRIVRAVRAVDTATHPEWQRRGVFRALTSSALDELRNDGVELVFNTPNDASRPGYLALGWKAVGRLPVVFRPSSSRGAVRAARARAPAARWSEPTEAGVPAREVLEDDATLCGLLDDRGTVPGLRTHFTTSFLRWRYATPPLCYRAVVHDAGVGGGVAVFRVRRRGTARELTLCELIVPNGDARARRRLIAAVRRVKDIDYALSLTPTVSLADGFVPLVGRGPILVARALGGQALPPRRGWNLSLGDIELF